MGSGKLFGREPAAYIPLVSAALMMAVGFGLPGLNDGTAAAITGFLAAAAAAWVAIRTRPVAPAIVMGVVTTGVAMFTAFGLDVDQGVSSGLTALLLAWFGLDTRAAVQPAEEVPPSAASAVLGRRQ